MEQYAGQRSKRKKRDGKRGIPVSISFACPGFHGSRSPQNLISLYNSRMLIANPRIAVIVLMYANGRRTMKITFTFFTMRNIMIVKLKLP
ncbi:hypothetical protein R70331_27895 [Paenibacillus sp. FSL R7-0331]|nr:hypothetical protein R70331_27895 [Paenibacillus sp. FSL R7-0331]